MKSSDLAVVLLVTVILVVSCQPYSAGRAPTNEQVPTLEKSCSSVGKEIRVTKDSVGYRLECEEK